MKAIIVGSSGMIGQAVLIECLGNNGVDKVLLINRRPSATKNQKIVEVIHKNFLDFSPIQDALSGYDVCFYCLGISAAGITDDQYTEITYQYTLNFANALRQANQKLTFIFVSGAGTDGSEKSSTLWQRVKGKTENALLNMDFHDAYMFRPAMIIPKKGVLSRTKSYRVMYKVLAPFLWLLRPAKGFVTDSEILANAMIRVTQKGYPVKILETSDINNAGKV